MELTTYPPIKTHPYKSCLYYAKINRLSKLPIFPIRHPFFLTLQLPPPPNSQWNMNYGQKLIDIITLSCPFKVRDYNTKNGTIKWHSIRRQKREWIKFAAACREGEDNSKRNPIAKVSINPKA